MERTLIDGDYVPDGAGGLKENDGAEEVLARVLFRLTARRGSFPFLPEFGSRLCLLGAVAPLARETAAERYVTEALAPETALKVESVRLREEELVVYLRCMGEERKLRLPLGEATA